MGLSFRCVWGFFVNQYFHLYLLQWNKKKIKRSTIFTMWIIETRNNNWKVGWFCETKKLPSTYESISLSTELILNSVKSDWLDLRISLYDYGNKQFSCIPICLFGLFIRGVQKSTEYLINGKNLENTWINLQEIFNIYTTDIPRLEFIVLVWHGGDLLVCVKYFS